MDENGYHGNGDSQRKGAPPGCSTSYYYSSNPSSKQTNKQKKRLEAGFEIVTGLLETPALVILLETHFLVDSRGWS